MITVREESEGNVLVIQASQKLTAKDYEEVFIPKLEQLIGEYGKIRAVLYLDDTFEGWDLGAMWDDAKFGIKHRHDFERIAILGGPKWLDGITRLSTELMQCDLKIFESTSLQDVVQWVKS